MAEHPDKLVVVTGVGPDTLGGAVVDSLLKKHPDTMVLTASRSSSLKTGRELRREHGDRYVHVGVDLADIQQREGLLHVIEAQAEHFGHRVAALIHALGPGFLDQEIENDPALGVQMRTLNLEVPLHLTEALNENGFLDADSHVVGIGGLFESEGVGKMVKKGPLAYAAVKKELAERLPAVSPQGKSSHLVVGNMDTLMLRKAVRLDCAELPWFCALPADPYRENGLGDTIAKFALDPNRIGSRLFLPNSAALINSIPHSDEHNWLPKMVAARLVVCGPAVLERFNVSRDHFNEALRYSREHETLGDFPYAWPERMVPLAVSRFLTAKMDAEADLCDKVEEPTPFDRLRDILSRVGVEL